MGFYDIIKIARRAVVLLICAAWFTTGQADMGFDSPYYKYIYLPEDTVTVNGVLYKTDFLNIPYEDEPFNKDYEWDELYTLRVETIVCLEHIASICDVPSDKYVFRFFDGSSLRAFDYCAKAVVDDSYREIWLEDSVPMQALPELRKTKYHYVCKLDGQLNKEKLSFLRTPKYLAIKHSQFADYKGLRTVRIGAAQSVMAYAFKNCEKLETVIFESAPYVWNEVFRNAPNIRRVVMEGKLPDPTGTGHYGSSCNCADRSPFDQEVYEKATLYVKAELIEDFRKDKTWGKFLNIRDIQEYISGVESVEADAEVEYQIYNMSGVQVRTAASGQDWREGLPSGIYLVRSSNGAVRKEYVR